VYTDSVSIYGERVSGFHPSTTKELSTSLWSGDIDSRADSFTDAVSRGQEVEALSPDVADKLEELEKEKQEVNDLWEEKSALYTQCMDLQLFLR